MMEIITKVLSFYDIDAASVDKLDEDGFISKITGGGAKYFLKIYNSKNDYDINPGEKIYYTYEQLQVEAEILNLLAGGALGTAVPAMNKSGRYVTAVPADETGDIKYAILTSFIDGDILENSKAPTTEIAYATGIATARLHLESERKLLPVAVRRPHKRQDYIGNIRERLEYGFHAGVLNAAQYKLLNRCCGVVLDCMNALDKDPGYNVGLVHTDIRNTNFIYTQNKVIPIDFSRSVYSYYLYDLGEICMHASFCGSNPELQNAVLRGYHSVKPLKREHPFMMQVFFTMFILTVIAEGVDKNNPPYRAWLDGVLIWFQDEVYPGLASGKGYLSCSVLPFAPSQTSNIDKI